jgi:hypothetical protein
MHNDFAKFSLYLFFRQYNQQHPIVIRQFSFIITCLSVVMLRENKLRFMAALAGRTAQSPKPRTSEAKDCSQNANLHRPLVDMGMLEKS